MKISDLVEELSLEIKSAKEMLGNEISGAYVSDLLSDVMGNTKKGDIWITLQTHLNIVAVASHADLSGIIITGSRNLPEDVLKKAESEKVLIAVTPLTAFELSGRLYQLMQSR